MACEKDVYLCLLENLALKANEVPLDDVVVRIIPRDELAVLLHCRPLDDLSPAEQAKVGLYSMCPWATLPKEVHIEEASDQDTAWERAMHQHQLAFAHAGGNSYWPFDSTIRTLNLLKASDGPVMPIQYFHLTPEMRTGEAEVAKIISGEPVTSGDEQGNEWPYLGGYDLRPQDVDGYVELKAKLETALQDKEADGGPRSTHICIADEYFERGNRSMQAILDKVPTVLMFAFALDALFLKEEERGSCPLWIRRVPEVVCPQTKVSPERLKGFLGDAFWIRSKAAHGVHTIHELNKRIRQADTGNLMLSPFAFNPLLVNLREILRLSIRFFLDKHAQGVPREQVLAGLDN